MQHGSAPAALVVWAAEAIPTPVPMQIARVTIDLMRPVPVAPLTLETEVLREGRKIQLCAVRLLADGRRRGRRDRAQDQDAALALPPDVADQPVELPGPDQSHAEPADFSSSPFVTGISMRAARGRFGVPGPGAIWYRVDRPLVEGFAVSQAMRAVVAADFCNGTSAALDFRRMDLHQCRSHRQSCAPAGRRVDPARRGILDRSRRRGPRHGAACRRAAAISAAPCRASSSRSDRADAQSSDSSRNHRGTSRVAVLDDPFRSATQVSPIHIRSLPGLISIGVDHQYDATCASDDRRLPVRRDPLQITSFPLLLYSCNCTNCQTASGSAFALNMPVLAEDFQF